MSTITAPRMLEVPANPHTVQAPHSDPQLKITLPQLLPILVYLGVSLTACILFGIAARNSEVQKDQKRSSLTWGCLGFMIAALILGVVWQILRLPACAAISISLLGILGPVAVLGLLYSANSLTFDSAVGWGVICAFTASQVLLKLLKAWIESCLSELWAGLLWSIYVIGIYLFLLGIPLFIVLIDQDLSDNLIQLAGLCGVTITVLIVGLWVPIQAKVFRQTDANTLAPAASIFLTYASSQGVVCYLLLQQVTENFEVTTEVTMLGTIYCFIPCFTLGGLSWTASQVSKETKQAVLVLLCGFSPLPVLLPIYFSSMEESQQVVLYLIIMLPLAAVFWSSLSILHAMKPVLFKIGAGLSCVLVAFPIGFLLPLTRLGSLPVLETGVLVCILLGLEVLICLSWTVYGLREFLKLDRIQKKLKVRTWNFYNGTLCLAMLLFMGAAGLLSWGLDNTPSDWRLGLLVGVLSTLPILYILSIVLLKAKVAPEQASGLTDIVNQLIQIEEDSESADLYTLRKRRIQQASAAGSCLGLVVLVVALSLQEASEWLGTLLLTLSLTLVVFFVASIIIIQLKYKAASFAKVLISSTISCCWLFIVVPFLVCIPLALTLSSGGDISKIVSFGVALAGLLFILGISAFSIVFNLLLRKLEQEKQARLVTECLIAELSLRRVRVDSHHMRVIYDQFKLWGAESYVSKLRDGMFFKMTRVTDEFYAQEIQPEGQREDTPPPPPKEQTPTVSCWTCLGCFSSLYPDSEVDEPSEQDRLNHYSLQLQSLSSKSVSMGSSWILGEEFREEGVDLESLEPVKLSFTKFNELRVNRECLSLLENKEAFENWFFLMFRLFARRFSDRRQYMRLADALEFFRLSGLQEVFMKGQIIHLYQSVSTPHGLTATLFLRKFLPRLDELSSRVHLFQLVQDKMYPNLVANLRGARLYPLPPEEFLSEHSELVEQVESYEEVTINVNSDTQEELWGNACYSFVQQKMSQCIEYIANLSSGLAKLLFVCAKLTSTQPKTDAQVSPVREVPQEEITDWDEAVDLIATGIESLEKIEEGQSQEANVVRFSMSNLFFVFSRLLEYYSLSAIAFMEKVGWSSSGDNLEFISSVLLIETNIVVPAFWVSVVLSLTFILLSKWALNRARRGLLGRADDGTLAKKCSASFWLSRSITLLGSVLYLFILKSFLNFMACGYIDNTWKMTRNNEMECFTGAHIAYVVMGSLGLLAYYPVATLIYPNLQFQSVGLDFKFTSTYLVLVSQVKLIISGVATFIEDDQIEFRLIVSGTGIAVLAVLSWWMQPCIIKAFNIWNCVGYSCSAWNTVAGLVVHSSQDPKLGLLMIAAFDLTAVGIGLFIYYRRFGRATNRRGEFQQSPSIIQPFSKEFIKSEEESPFYLDKVSVI